MEYRGQLRILGPALALTVILLFLNPVITDAVLGSGSASSPLGRMFEIFFEYNVNLLLLWVIIFFLLGARR